MHSSINKAPAETSPPTEIVTLCAICGSSDSELLFRNFDRLHHLPGEFALVKCKHCGLVFLSPRPGKEVIGFYYPEQEYAPYENKVSLKDIKVRRRFIGRIRDGIRDSVLASMGYDRELSGWEELGQPLFSYLFRKPGTFGWGDRFPPYKKGGRALDIGCASGEFLGCLKEFGWDVAGVEMSATAASFARKKRSIEVHQGLFEDAPFSPESFDFITTSHVLEHVYEPIAFLRKAADLLKGDGVFHIEVPNCLSFNCKRSRQYWLHWDSPRHLYAFSPETLQMVVEAAGLEIVRLYTKVDDIWRWDVTYREEERLRTKLENRPLATRGIRAKNFLRKNTARVAKLFDPYAGDSICCWVMKR